MSSPAEIQLPERFLESLQTGHFILERQRTKAAHWEAAGRRIFGHIRKHFLNLLLDTVMHSVSVAVMVLLRSLRSTPSDRAANRAPSGRSWAIPGRWSLLHSMAGHWSTIRRTKTDSILDTWFTQSPEQIWISIMAFVTLKVRHHIHESHHRNNNRKIKDQNTEIITRTNLDQRSLHQTHRFLFFLILYPKNLQTVLLSMIIGFGHINQTQHRDLDQKWGALIHLTRSCFTTRSKTMSFLNHSRKTKGGSTNDRHGICKWTVWPIANSYLRFPHFSHTSTHSLKYKSNTSRRSVNGFPKK